MPEGIEIGTVLTGPAIAALTGALTALLLSGPALAQSRPAHGLIESATNLPRTLPLVVELPDDRDVYVQMHDADTGQVALTAYARGGRPLQIMMPPGRYTLSAALGEDWQGPEQLFGSGTRRYVHPASLGFRAGYAKKRGHLVDLGAKSARAIATCRVGVLSQRDRPLEPMTDTTVTKAVTTSVAPDIRAGALMPPGPRDPVLDGWADLGANFANIVPDVPIGQKLGEGRLPSAGQLDFDVPRRTVSRERACDPG